MEKQVIFRDYQEELAADHNNLQTYARDAIDHVVNDAVTVSRRFAGFGVAKSSQTEVTAAPGRMYDQGGAVYGRASALVQSMIPYLASAAQRIVSISAYGVENETGTEERDVLTNVDTGATEPQSVSTTRSRDAVLVFTQGAESADPQPPALPATHVEIARVLLDPTQVVSVTMMEVNRVTSTDALDQRADVLEAFKDQIGPRVSSLASDLADLASRVAGASTRNSLSAVYLDLARLKASLRFPEEAADYGADFFLRQNLSDVADTFGQGYDAKVEQGIRFPDANADEFEISLFAANDPNAALANGVLLPKHSDEVKISTGPFVSDLGMAQYGFQTVAMQQGYMSRSRLRYGSGFFRCSNGMEFNVPGQPTDLTNLYDLTSTSFTAIDTIVYNGPDSNHEMYYADTWWYDTWKEPYLYAVTTEHTVNGAMVFQTWLQSNDTWMTRLGFYVTQKAANEDIHLAVCELTAGVPDLDKTIMKIVHPQANIVIGWNRLATPYTFLAKGKRFALVMISNANHKLGMADGNGFLNGTFGYSTDGAYFQGDLTKDMMLEVWGARFDAAQVTIEFAPINLDGGFRNIDILAEMYVPDSCQFFYEMRPGGAGDWQPLVNDAGAILASAPPLAQFRGRFVGTADMAPALTLDGSRVHVSRPKTALKHVSTDITLATPADEIHVIVTLENFDETPHDHALTLKTGSTHTVAETPDTTVTKLLDAQAKRYQREYVFNLAGGNITHFIIIQTGATTSAANTFHVAERDFYTA